MGLPGQWRSWNSGESYSDREVLNQDEYKYYEKKMPNIKVGIAGGGFIGCAHIEALRRIGARVIGIAEADPKL